MKFWMSSLLGCGGSKSRLQGQILDKPHEHTRHHTYFGHSLPNMATVFFASKKSWINLLLGHVGSRSWSLGQILENPCDHARGHIFVQNVLLHTILDEFGTGSHVVKM